jgi:hypothetical protein
MPCETCRLWFGKNVEHEICTFRSDLRCRRCCGSGHSSSECTINSIAIYPNYIEDLIPQDIKDIYNIISQTEYNKPEKIIEPHPVRCIEIVNSDKWIREFMKHQRLQTARKREDNLTKIFDWAHTSGLKINLINE